ncbi:TonB-dependent receptor [Tellurirhabdus bombi]|uniref:TonB-dependent receptor n=1 Tax=Tellurirhabdus bombi TaxID=2907205 RepID=UPI001F3BAE1B|nr:TonB-dependent receptor [Tellurirhabdus bombi]
MRPFFTVAFLSFILSLFYFNSLAQTPTQTIRGVVYDAQQWQPLSGASVSLRGGTVSGVITDEQGRFRLTNVPLGRHQVSVSFIGYESTVINEVLVESGKEQVLEIRLQPGATQLGEATVSGARTDRTISAEHITAEQVLRFPATYLDPARLATAYAGVVNTNDQANNISVRGNSPNSLIWRLEGVEIVNPNHLSNAGTIGDRPTASGGGVNILSAQLLGTTRFMTGAFSPEYGNTIGGVMDMGLRRGNNEKHEFTAQAGLIGLDVAAEGPISKAKGSSYIVNYRYSFTGLLGAMGVSFGGEDIRFQDLSFNLVFPTRKGGRFTVFGVGGTSRNDFTAKADSEQVEDKDRYSIYYKSRMGVGGFTFTQPLGQRGLWKTALVISANRNDRDQILARTSTGLPAYQFDYNANSRSSLLNSFSYRLSNRHRLQAGVYLTRWYGAQLYLGGDNAAVKDQSFDEVLDENHINGWLIEPYVDYQWQPVDRLTINAGLHYNHFTLNSASRSLEPRASVQWEARPGQTFSLAYGLHSQTQQPAVYLSFPANGTDKLISDHVGFTKAHHWVLNYTRQLSDASYFKAEAYWQQLFDVPVLSLGSNQENYAVLNQINTDYMIGNLTNTGSARNRGVELTYQKYLSKSYYLLASGSVYSSQYYRMTTKTWYSTRFDGRFTTNLTGGKEWQRKSSDGSNSRIWGVNGRISYLGGFRDRPIDAALSVQQGYTVYSSQDYNVKLPDYFRTDLRIYWKKSKARYSRTLSLDLQNLTSAKNAAYFYFDAVQGKVVRKNQLGLLPILAYRWEF